MTLAIVHSRTNQGIQALPVYVEADVSPTTLPRFSIVGLAETVIKESKDRVRSAIHNSHFTFPAKRIIINLAPADLPKEGTRFDLPIALGILAASRQIPSNFLNGFEFAGELALSGELRAIQGVLPFALATREAKRSLIIPDGNAHEASLVQNADIYCAHHLLDIHAHLNGEKKLTRLTSRPIPEQAANDLDIADVIGQHHAKRALTIAAAGGHSLLMSGPPGTGKTMLAQRLPSLLPRMSEQEMLESAAVASFEGKSIQWGQRPFRSPHHTASHIALVGGGNPPQPGEISLAHHGILFLDECTEFKRNTLETLREPLESGSINIARAARRVNFPACFQLIAAMNPCPCGQLSHPHRHCRCTPAQITRYRNRLSSPLLDRIDLFIEVPPLSRTEQEPKTPLTSATLKKQVDAARCIQQQRQSCINARIPPATLKRVCHLAKSEHQFLQHALSTFQFSTRRYHNILRVARTIADLAGNDAIQEEHLSEALGYRWRDEMGNE